MQVDFWVPQKALRNGTKLTFAVKEYWFTTDPHDITSWQRPKIQKTQNKFQQVSFAIKFPLDSGKEKRFICITKHRAVQLVYFVQKELAISLLFPKINDSDPPSSPHQTTVKTLSTIFSHLKAPPDAVKMILLSAPSGNPWIHCREEILLASVLITYQQQETSKKKPLLKYNKKESCNNICL